MKGLTRLCLVLAVSLLLPSGGNAAVFDDDQVAARCAEEWGADFAMQLYCRQSETSAARQVESFCSETGFCPGTPEAVEAAASDGDPFARIYRLCLREWSDRHGPEWMMLSYCIEQQLEALQRLQ